MQSETHRDVDYLKSWGAARPSALFLCTGAAGYRWFHSVRETSAADSWSSLVSFAPCPTPLKCDLSKRFSKESCGDIVESRASIGYDDSVIGFGGRNTTDLPGGNRGLRVQVTDNASGTSTNVQLSVLAGSNSITLSGNNIIHTSGGVATTASANPASGVDLVISFNANATRITALLEQLRVRAVAGASTGAHVLTVRLTESDADAVSITRNFTVT